MVRDYVKNGGQRDEIFLLSWQTRDVERHRTTYASGSYRTQAFHAEVQSMMNVNKESISCICLSLNVISFILSSPNSGVIRDLKFLFEPNNAFQSHTIILLRTCPFVIHPHFGRSAP